MKTATVRELRNHYTKLLRWVARGEEVEVTRRGKVVARVIPPGLARMDKVDWARSAALNRPAWSATLTAEQSAAIMADSRGD